ncbi:extracellular matrix regulator RemB [Halalkalibacterium halodurans]|uniref:DUF370 domain-containing protein n=1 Tax=Halalkalibacterium halodurans TaxID=86665 RepID=A0A0M0KDL0_ALKHA|nr:extracellular matrix/biofilm biosynthesis regulator RemA family protein [Halalkalibacterium halodurans]MED4161817.1 DUF370 domain-containing protein [Halalkalibacterium halodurans]TPE68265.1 DUF370 domain-containing protein [Halalkalibacterium halodurans]
MFIHLGGDHVIRSKDVIAILDRDMEQSSGVTKEYLEHHQKNGNIVTISSDLIKSIVVTPNTIYYSPISSVTLKRRSHAVSELDRFGEEE